MDRRRVVAAFVALGLGLAAGCGGSGSSAPSAGSAADAGSQAALPSKPELVVREFLEAVRTGNDERAAQMLTDLARQETHKHEIVVSPPGSETAKFEVGDVEFVIKDELAHVASKWTDIGEDGQPHSDDIVWALRLDKSGWRIAGMATRIFPDEPPLLLDFENPEEMLQQQRLAEEEMQRRASGAATQAQQPAKPADGNVLRQ